MKRTVWITSDIGGSDPDDIQSMIHLFQYSDELQIAGVTAGVPRGKKKVLKRVRKLYKKDYKKYAWQDTHQAPADIKIYQGKKKSGDWSNTEEVRALVRQSRLHTPENPLIICAWGAATDLAAAVKNGLALKNCFAYLIMGFHPNDWNGKQDKKSFDLLKKTNGLRRIFADSTIRGMYVGWNKHKNRNYVKKQIKPKGRLGKYFYKISKHIDNGASGPYSIKMGDTPSILWVLSSPNLNPLEESWGGRFREVGTKMYGALEGEKIGNYSGAATIKRKMFLRDWKKKLKEIYK